MLRSLLVSVLLSSASVVATGASKFRMFCAMVALSSARRLASISTVSRNLNSEEVSVEALAPFSFSLVFPSAEVMSLDWILVLTFFCFFSPFWVFLSFDFYFCAVVDFGGGFGGKNPNMRPQFQILLSALHSLTLIFSSMCARSAFLSPDATASTS